MTTPNKTFVYKKIPTAYPLPGEHVTIEDRPINLGAVPSGGIVVEVQYASLDPYLRGRMRDPKVKSYSPPFELDGPVAAGCVAKVLKSDTAAFAVDDFIVALIPIAQYAVIPGELLAASRARKIVNRLGLDLAHFLGACGMPGLTAWSGLHKIGQPKAGETLFVSSAAGAVGQIVGQIAKKEGLKVIGSVGSDDKLSFIVNELGFDGGFNYKKEKVSDALARLAPEGLDIYFENVGGEHLEAALVVMKKDGRIPVCGMITEYNVPPEQRRPVSGLLNVLSKQLVMEGFLVGKPGFGDKYFVEHQESMQKWLADGSIKAKLHVTEGIDGAGEAFVGMLKGENFGKAVIKIKV